MMFWTYPNITLFCLLSLRSLATPVASTENIIATLEDITSAELESDVERRQWVNCQSEKSVFDYSCWDKLNISSYITKWAATTPICTTDESDSRMDGSGCCTPGEPWAKCFLRVARGKNDQDCSVISESKCGSDIELNPTLNSSIRPQMMYVQKNLHEINTFFDQYYKGAIARKT